MYPTSVYNNNSHGNILYITSKILPALSMCPNSWLFSVSICTDLAVKVQTEKETEAKKYRQKMEQMCQIWHMVNIDSSHLQPDMKNK